MHCRVDLRDSELKMTKFRRHLAGKVIFFFPKVIKLITCTCCQEILMSSSSVNNNASQISNKFYSYLWSKTLRKLSVSNKIFKTQLTWVTDIKKLSSTNFMHLSEILQALLITLSFSMIYCNIIIYFAHSTLVYLFKKR